MVVTLHLYTPFSLAYFNISTNLGLTNGSPPVKLIFIFLPFDEEKKDDFIKGFKNANKRIRKEIAKRVQLKYTPSLSFVFDDTIKEIRKLDELFSSNKVSNDIKS